MVRPLRRHDATALRCRPCDTDQREYPVPGIEHGVPWQAQASREADSEDKRQKATCGPVIRSLCVCPCQADGHEQLLWRMAKDHRAQEHCFLLPISTARPQMASYNSLLNAVLDNCGHCLENHFHQK